MKHLFKSLASLALAAFAYLAAPSAFALTTEHGSICKGYGYSTQAGFYSSVNGLYNYTGNYAGMICPVVRTVAAPSTGFSVWVDGNASGATGSCTLYSYNFTGAYLGSVSVTVGPGVFDKLVTLPASQVPTFSSQAMYCYLPNNSAVYDVEPVQ